MDGAKAEALGTEIVEKVVVAPPAPRKQGRGRPQKLSKRIAAVIALRLEGHSNREIARALGIQERSVRQLIYQARRKGGFSDVLDRIDGIALPQATENLIEGLRNGDKEYTLETLKGRGVFRNHSQVKSEGGGGGGNTLLVKIEMPQMAPGAAAPQIAEGAIVGAPRILATPVPAALPEPAPEPVLDAHVEAIPDAVQVPIPARVDAREQTRDGEGVGSAHPGGGQAAGARRPTIDEIAARFEQAAYERR